MDKSIYNILVSLIGPTNTVEPKSTENKREIVQKKVFVINMLDERNTYQ